MSGWKVNTSKVLLETTRFNVIEDSVVDFADQERKMLRIKNHHPGYVMIVPIKFDPQTNRPKFILTEQYRYVLNIHQLEFPAGKREPFETSEQAAIRELKEETGYTAKNIKFLYRTFVGGPSSNDEINIYVASVEGTPAELVLTDREIGSQMKVKEFTTDELHQLIIKNEITNTATLSSLLVLMLQTEEAMKYLTGLNSQFEEKK